MGMGMRSPMSMGGEMGLPHPGAGGVSAYGQGQGQGQSQGQGQGQAQGHLSNYGSAYPPSSGPNPNPNHNLNSNSNSNLNASASSGNTTPQGTSAESGPIRRQRTGSAGRISNALGRPMGPGHRKGLSGDVQGAMTAPSSTNSSWEHLSSAGNAGERGLERMFWQLDVGDTCVW